jgi:hypothetical protein
VHSNDDTLTAADVALGYKQLQRFEVPRAAREGFKTAYLLASGC